MTRIIKTLFWISVTVFIFSLQVNAEEKEVVKEEKDTHKVSKGDTLWDISKKYRNDPFQWPKIWKLNPYITNPHLIFPGQVILLEERIYVKKPEAEMKMEPEAAVPVAEKMPVYSYPLVVSAGFILKEKPSAYSVVVSSHREQRNYYKGNDVFIDKRKGIVFKEGVSYFVVDANKVVVHPITKEEVGYLYSIKGIVRVDSIYKDTVKAIITESYDLIAVGDMVIPFKSFSDQIVLKKNDKFIGGVVVDGKGGKGIFGQNQVVYIDKGLKDGVEVGNKLKVIKRYDYIYKDFKELGGAIPVESFAEALIIIAEDHFSTALITDSKKDVHIGYTVISQ